MDTSLEKDSVYKLLRISIYQSFFKGKKMCIIHGYIQCVTEANNNNCFIIIIDCYKIESKRGIVEVPVLYEKPLGA